jgi:hypothetical protein
MEYSMKIYRTNSALDKDLIFMVLFIVIAGELDPEPRGLQRPSSLWPIQKSIESNRASIN